MLQMVQNIWSATVPQTRLRTDPMGRVCKYRGDGSWSVLHAGVELACFYGAHAECHAAMFLRCLRAYWRRMER